jgi:DNA polymerase-3 subunit delta'
MHASQRLQWQQLHDAFLQQRLSHAYLLSGIKGLGKTALARAFAALLLCEQHTACQHCHGCILMRAESHPDFIMVSPAEKSQTIKIDQIRAIREKLSQTAHEGGYQVVIIAPADAMLTQAANALLKTLEEPTGQVVIFLIDDQKSALPATIVSRCQKIFFSSHGLDLQGQAQDMKRRDQLLAVLEKIACESANPVALVPPFLNTDNTAIVDSLILLCADIARVQHQVDACYMIYKDKQACCEQIAKKITPIALQYFMDKLLDKKSMITRNIHLNQQLCLEDIFIAWEHYVY